MCRCLASLRTFSCSYVLLLHCFITSRPENYIVSIITVLPENLFVPGMRQHLRNETWKCGKEQDKLGKVRLCKGMCI